MISYGTGMQPRTSIHIHPSFLHGTLVGCWFTLTLVTTEKKKSNQSFNPLELFVISPYLWAFF
jgi:hypothetical protein